MDPIEQNSYTYIDAIIDEYRKIANLPYDLSIFFSQKVNTVGKIKNRRHFGKSIFLDLIYGNYKLQILSHHHQSSFKVAISCAVNDAISVQGMLQHSTSGDLVLKVDEMFILSKSVNQLPREVKDENIRRRQRYIDLLIRKGAMDTFLERSKIIKAVRDFMHDMHFVEVETPLLHAVASGAAAKPFSTTCNDTKDDLYLRIAPELYLKMLQVGNIPRIFEIGKSFRNEGISNTHNPEFTTIEAYASYEDYIQGMHYVNEIVMHVAEKCGFTPDHPFRQSFLKYSIKEYVMKMYQLDEAQVVDKSVLNLILQRNNISTSHKDIDMLQFQIFDELLEDTIVHPTFITHYPVESSPLAMKCRDNPRLVERAELFIQGMEIANIYTELNDAQEQAERFKAQDAVATDNAYCECLKYNLPPAVGLGIGIDRLVMIMTNNKSIRDVIFFPLMRDDKDSVK